MHTPSPIDLKPLLDRCIAEFPGCKIELHFKARSEFCSTSVNAQMYQVVLKVNLLEFHAPTFEGTLPPARRFYAEIQEQRVAAANAMRAKADQIERGEIAI